MAQEHGDMPHFTEPLLTSRTVPPRSIPASITRQIFSKRSDTILYLQRVVNARKFLDVPHDTTLLDKQTNGDSEYWNL